MLQPPSLDGDGLLAGLADPRSGAVTRSLVLLRRQAEEVGVHGRQQPAPSAIEGLAAPQGRDSIEGSGEDDEVVVTVRSADSTGP